MIAPPQCSQSAQQAASTTVGAASSQYNSRRSKQPVQQSAQQAASTTVGAADMHIDMGMDMRLDMCIDMRVIMCYLFILNGDVTPPMLPLGLPLPAGLNRCVAPYTHF